MNKSQVKSKARVADHGEVFTADREVNAMLDMVIHETERIDSRFLEPACGDGNFLVEILRRKLNVVKRKYKKSPFDYEKNAVLAASSIYGVDLLIDNVEICRNRLFDIWDEQYKIVCKKEVNDDCRKAVRFILERNILCGNALTLKQVDANGIDTEEPIVFSEWSFIFGVNMQRKDYRFDKLMEGTEKGKDLYKKEEKVKEIEGQLNMFSDLSISDKEEKTEISDEGELVFQYTKSYRRIWEYEE